MIVTADDVGDAHIVIVDDDGQHVCRRAVRSQQHEVVEIFILPDNAPLHLVIDNGLASEWRLQPDHRIDACGSVLRVAIAASAIVEPRSSFRARLLAHRSQFVRAAIATIGMTGGEELLGDLPMACSTGELEDDLSVPAQSQPGQAIDDGVDGRGRGALAVSILDPQQHLAAMPARVEPIEEGRPASTDMKKAGGRRGKSGNNVAGHVEVE